MENFFTKIAKLLAISQTKRELNKVKGMLDEDPDLQATLDSIKYHYTEFEKKLTSYCERHPDSPMCKKGFR